MFAFIAHLQTELHRGQFALASRRLLPRGAAVVELVEQLSWRRLLSQMGVHFHSKLTAVILWKKSTRSRKMSRAWLEERAHIFMQRAHENLMKDGSLAFAVLVWKNSTMVPIFVKVENDEQKEQLGQLLRRIARDCEAIFMICEAWAVLEANAQDITLPVRTSPKRQEVITVTAQSPEGEAILTSVFDRDAQGNPTEPAAAITFWEPFDGARFTSSKFGNLFAAPTA